MQVLAHHAEQQVQLGLRYEQIGKIAYHSVSALAPAIVCQRQFACVRLVVASMRRRGHGV